MIKIFQSVLTMSASAVMVIPAALLIRLLLKKAPRKFSYLLWVIVFIRLACPFSPNTAFGFIPDIRIPLTAASGVISGGLADAGINPAAEKSQADAVKNASAAAGKAEIAPAGEAGYQKEWTAAVYPDRQPCGKGRADCHGR